MDFTTVISSQDQNLSAALVIVDTQLRQLHAKGGDLLYREDIEGNDPTFLEGQEVVTSNGILPIAGQLAHWGSTSIQYSLYDLTFELLMCRWSGGFVNTYLRVPVRDMRRLKSEDRLTSYHLVLTSIANALHGTAGVGDVELEFAPFPPDSFPSAILRNPYKDFLPAALGLLSDTRYSESDVARIFSGRFRLERLAGYFLLEGTDYPEPGMTPETGG